MTVRILHRGFNFSQDGPGNRLVYHLQGCNMHCPWCANPESVPINGCIMVTGAEADRLCPHGSIHDGTPDPAVCDRCDKPCLALRSPHLKFSCVERTIEDVLAEIDRSSMLFFDGGGVTFTGGEATVQFEALSALLTALHEKGVHTALETNGAHKALPSLFDRIDWLIMDLKHPDAAKHRAVIGCSNAPTLDNLRLAAERREQLAVRIPLIGGFNDTPADAAAFAAILSCLHGEQTVEVLRYHEYGRDKWKQCGKVYAMQNAFVSDETYRAFCTILRDSGLTLVHT